MPIEFHPHLEFSGLNPSYRRITWNTPVGLWLADVLASHTVAGSRLLDIDYAEYAEAEASLGWLNWRASLQLRRAHPPAAIAGPRRWIRRPRNCPGA